MKNIQIFCLLFSFLIILTPAYSAKTNCTEKLFSISDFEERTVGSLTSEERRVFLEDITTEPLSHTYEELLRNHPDLVISDLRRMQSTLASNGIDDSDFGGMATRAHFIDYALNYDQEIDNVIREISLIREAGFIPGQEFLSRHDLLDLQILHELEFNIETYIRLKSVIHEIISWYNPEYIYTVLSVIKWNRVLTPQNDDILVHQLRLNSDDVLDFELYLQEYISTHQLTTEDFLDQESGEFLKLIEHLNS